MAETFEIKKGATLPTFTNVLYTGGTPTPLTGTGVIRMKHQFGDYFERAYTPDPDQEANPGKISVNWDLSDINDRTLGTYYVECVHTFEDAAVGIWPTSGEMLYDKIKILPPLSA